MYNSNSSLYSLWALSLTFPIFYLYSAYAITNLFINASLSRGDGLRAGLADTELNSLSASFNDVIIEAMLDGEPYRHSFYPSFMCAS